MAVIKPKPGPDGPVKTGSFAGQEAQAAGGSPLQALTAAALVLPGLVAPMASADDDEVGFQYSHYQEGKRHLYGTPNHRNPIEVDTLHGGAKLSLTDRIKFAFNYTQDTWGGATPVTTAPIQANGNSYDNMNHLPVSGATPFISGRHVILDSNFNPVTVTEIDENNILSFKNENQIVHTLSVASPETRKQGDFKLSYEWDNAGLTVGGGESEERDYLSRFGSINGRLDFNQKLTTVNVGLSYTNSDTHAIIDHDAISYINYQYYQDQGLTEAQTLAQFHDIGSRNIIKGNRQDWSANLGLTQILGKNTLMEANVGYTRSTGYMANPYKAVTAIFFDPTQGQNPDFVDPFGDGRNFITGNQGIYPQGYYDAFTSAILEKRPALRNQWQVGTRLVQYIEPFSAAFHFDYHFSHDDWGINAHTFEADWVQPLGWGWTVTPRVRYYSQDAAYFYSPYFIIPKAPGTGNDARRQDYQNMPANYSSDQRLSGYGALSGGISVSKQFSKGLTLETGFEYYTHSGSLKIGGGGEGDYSSFDYYVASASLKLNLDTLSFSGNADDEHAHRHHHHGAAIPAGVMFGHMMDKAGDWMVGYRYMYSTQAGNMLHGDDRIADSEIVTQGCGTTVADYCYITPTNMNMHMHMLDIMYAPTDWLNVMLMPQFMDMNMSFRDLQGTPPTPNSGKYLHIPHHLSSGHATGGVGDTGMYALFKLWGGDHHRVNLSLGATAPTGDVTIMLRRNHQVEGGFIHYGMQLGSGTWDFKPALTYTGRHDKWSWGAQMSGTKRLQDKNVSGYALGDIFQSTAWGSYHFFDWLSGTVRGVYTTEGAIKGQYNGLIQALGPMDYPRNYGGKFWDLGLGLNASVVSGTFAGHNISFEWLQPISTDFNGYQLDRNGALSATWSYGF